MHPCAAKFANAFTVRTVRWEASQIGYAVVAPTQGYAQLAELEIDIAAFSSASASSYDLADDIFVNGSVGACFDASDLPLTLDTMASREYVGETFSDATRHARCTVPYNPDTGVRYILLT